MNLVDPVQITAFSKTKRLKFGLIDVLTDAKYWQSILWGLVCATLTVGFPIIAITKGALKNINILAWDERILINLAIVFGAITAGAAYKTALHFPSAIKEKRKKPTNLKEAFAWLKAMLASNWGFLLLQSTVLLNTAAAALCKRISVTEIVENNQIEVVLSALGLGIFAFGGLLLGSSVINRPLRATEKVVEATHGHSAGAGNGKKNGNGNNIDNGGGHGSGDGTAVDSGPDRKKGKSSKPLPLVQYPELSAWLVIIASIALVENAWMPLLSLPGVLVGMKWYLSGRAATVPFAGDGAELDVQSARWKIVPFIY